MKSLEEKLFMTKTKGITLRADQFEALRILSTATGKSINALLIGMIEEAMTGEKAQN